MQTITYPASVSVTVAHKFGVLLVIVIVVVVVIIVVSMYWHPKKDALGYLFSVRSALIDIVIYCIVPQLL